MLGMNTPMLLAATTLAILALPACGPSAAIMPQILLYNGTGASPNDVKAIEEILHSQQFSYATADSAALNAMPAAELRRYRLLIVPGGNYIKMGEGLTPAAAANVREAVRGGVNYLGICAGALLAGDAKTRSFNLTDGVHFDFYGVVNQNIHKTAVRVTDANGETLDHYWEDGPQLSGWGKAVARYPDGTPAVSEGAVGLSWVVLCGVHPEAPASWRAEKGLAFTTPASASHDYAARLIQAALDRDSLASDSD
jgi:hypothetical protein